MLVKLHDLLDYQIAGQDGSLGAPRDIYFDDTSWCIRYFVVDTGSWLPGRKVLLAMQSVAGIDTAIAAQATKRSSSVMPPRSFVDKSTASIFAKAAGGGGCDSSAEYIEIFSSASCVNNADDH